MIKRLIIILEIFFYTRSYFINKLIKNLNTENLNYDHENIFFNDLDEIKKLIYLKKDLHKHFIKKDIDYYHGFDWLHSAKKIGGAESLYYSKIQLKKWYSTYSKKNILNWENKILALAHSIETLW